MSWGDSYTPTKNSFTQNGKLLAPNSDFGSTDSQTNPYDPTDSNQYADYVSWQISHPGSQTDSSGAQEVGSDFSPAALGTLLGAQVAMGMGQGGGVGMGGGGGGFDPAFSATGDAAMSSGGAAALTPAYASAISGGSGASNLASLLGGGSNPYMQAAQIGLGIAGGIEGARQTGAQLDLQRQQLAQQADEFKQQLAQNNSQFQANLGQTQGQQALAATQQNPFKASQAREAQALLAGLAGAGGWKSALSNPSTFSGMAQFATPDAMAAQEQSFNQNAGAASGGKFVPPDQSKVGYTATTLAKLLGNSGGNQ